MDVSGAPARIRIALRKAASAALVTAAVTAVAATAAVALGAAFGSVLAPSPAFADSLTLSTPRTELAPGTSATIPVRVTGVPASGITGGELVFALPDDGPAITAIAGSTALGEGLLEVNSADGRFVMAGAEAMMTEDGVLAVLTVTAAASCAPGEYTLSITVNELYDNNLRDITCTIDAGAVVVTAASGGEGAQTGPSSGTSSSGSSNSEQTERGTLEEPTGGIGGGSGAGAASGTSTGAGTGTGAPTPTSTVESPANRLNARAALPSTAAAPATQGGSASPNAPTPYAAYAATRGAAR